MITGKIAYRIGFLGRVILQVEYKWRGMPAYSRHVEEQLRWRDATVQDLVNLDGYKLN